MRADIVPGDLYYRGMRDFASIQGADLPRFSGLMDHLFRIYEDMYYQKLEGHLDPRVWRGFEAPMRDIIAYPGAQKWWGTRSHWFSREFQQFIAGLVRAAAPPSMYREPEPQDGVLSVESSRQVQEK
jgi:hypothetical protein